MKLQERIALAVDARSKMERGVNPVTYYHVPAEGIEALATKLAKAGYVDVGCDATGSIPFTFELPGFHEGGKKMVQVLVGAAHSEPVIAVYGGLPAGIKLDENIRAKVAAEVKAAKARKAADSRFKSNLETLMPTVASAS